MAGGIPIAASWLAGRAPMDALALTILGFLPAFLVGALSVQIDEDLSLGPTALGIATAFFFASAGVLAPYAGRLVHRLPLQRSWRFSLAMSAFSLVIVAAAPTYPVLVLGLLLGGLGNALSQPTANRILAQTVDETRLGIAFGLKQGAVPVATLLAGLAVPGIALTLGWRWAMLAAALAACVTLTGTGHRGLSRAGVTAHIREVRIPKGVFFLLTLGVGFGAASSTALAVFFTGSGVDIGFSAATSGLLFALCSLVVLLLRIGFGWLVDRRPRIRTYAFVGNLMIGGSLGYALLASDRPSVFVGGAALAFGAGWTWTGLFEYAIVRDHLLSAAKVSGAAQSGLLLGAAAGPTLFGVVAGASSRSAAWMVVGVLSLLAGLLVSLSSHLMRRHSDH